MARNPRCSIDDGWIHVMNRGARRLPVFGDDRDHEAFLEGLGAAATAHELEVHAYALMPNHFHLLMNGTISALAATMQQLCGRYTQRFNARYGYDGALCRGRYRAKPVDSSRQLHAVVRYIHRNPLGDGAPLRLASFRWTSHLAYAGVVPAQEWLTTGRVLAGFGGDVASYRRFVEGTEAAGGEALEQGVGFEPRPRPLQPSDIELALGVDSPTERETIRQGGRGIRNDLRLACVHLCTEWTSTTTAVLAARYGFGSASSVRSATAKARQLEATDATFRALVDAARLRLGAQFGRGSDPSVRTWGVGESAA